ncbi:hypothetical protein DFQ30_008858 [Apophysomyces sp. BC1015]|nr:hypothetical protein DFQ30_008858 [Apophysomyces sp. BC1015]
MNRAIRRFQAYDTDNFNNQTAYEQQFLVEILETLAKDVYDGQHLSYSETLLNDSLIFPALKACRRMVQNMSRRDFKGNVGTAKQTGLSNSAWEEDQLRQAIQECLRDVPPAKASVFFSSRPRFPFPFSFWAEIMLLGTSWVYGMATGTKTSFDQLKGMYGTLAMMKTFADEYLLANFETFKMLEVHFLHVHGKLAIA